MSDEPNAAKEALGLIRRGLQERIVRRPDKQEAKAPAAAASIDAQAEEVEDEQEPEQPKPRPTTTVLETFSPKTINRKSSKQPVRRR